MIRSAFVLAAAAAAYFFILAPLLDMIPTV